MSNPRRSRNMLHFNKLTAFKAWLQEHGWVEEQVRGTYEILRMCHPSHREPCIAHARDSATEHVTTWGKSEQLARDFLREQRTTP